MTLLGSFAIVAASSARAATTVEAKASVYDALATILPAAPFHKIRIARVHRTLAPVADHLAPVLSTAAVNRGHIVCF